MSDWENAHSSCLAHMKTVQYFQRGCLWTLRPTVEKLQTSAAKKNTECGERHLLIVHDGGAISSHGLLFDHTDELEGAAERRIGIGPFRTLEMSHLQDIVVL